VFTPYLVMAARTAMVVLFVASAGSKAVDVRRFERSVRDFELLPARWSRVAALCFLAAESSVVALLAVGGPVLLPGFVLAILLLAIFAAALEAVVRRRLLVDCGCFGGRTEAVSRYDVARNLLFALLAASGVGAIAFKENQSAHLPAGDVVLLTMMSAVFVVLAVNLKPLVTALRRPLE
jgi:Methylamine utilisation protein MauE